MLIETLIVQAIILPFYVQLIGKKTTSLPSTISDAFRTIASLGQIGSEGCIMGVLSNIHNNDSIISLLI